MRRGGVRSMHAAQRHARRTIEVAGVEVIARAHAVHAADRLPQLRHPRRAIGHRRPCVRLQVAGGHEKAHAAAGARLQDAANQVAPLRAAGQQRASHRAARHAQRLAQQQQRVVRHARRGRRVIVAPKGLRAQQALNVSGHLLEAQHVRGLRGHHRADAAHARLQRHRLKPYVVCGSARKGEQRRRSLRSMACGSARANERRRETHR